MAKLKKLNYELLTTGHQAYDILRKMLKHHPDLASAKVGLAWRKVTNPDVDGHVVLGRCVKVSDLQKEFMDYDFIIVLNQEIWNDAEFTREKKEALLDHELCHAAPAEDDEGVKIDERGRNVWRTRKHDIEEFHVIIQRHGCYKRDLEAFAEQILRKRTPPSLFEQKKGGDAAAVN